MSDSQQSARSIDEHASRASGNPIFDSPNELPVFQSFPAATGDARLRPSPRTQADSNTLQVAPSGTHDDAIDHPHEPREDMGDPMLGGPQHTTTSSAFYPFPRAAPGSRWAPPDGARPQPARPIPPPTFVPEPALFPSYSSGAGRYPSNLPPGQSSPYDPPGPLTARPHICEHCETGFARAHDLRRHLATHETERPHKCPYCQRSFSRKDAVQRHLLLTQCTGSAAGSSSNN